MLINANHLSLTIQNTSILSDVSLHLESGEIYGLLGPNGAGKSSTISLLLGLYPVDNDSLEIFDTSPSKNWNSVRTRIGVMPENAGFYDWMNAYEYLIWHAGFYGGLQEPVSVLLELVGLDNAGIKPISQYSRGMKQRLALARALVHNPELLILDEPTNGLDPRGRREVHDLLFQLVEERGVGILLCTHLLDDVERLCTKIGIIDRGRSIVEGKIDDLVQRESDTVQFRILFNNIPSEKILPHEITVLHQEGNWYHIAIPRSSLPAITKLWENLIVLGWGISEIHSVNTGLEDLYMQLTTNTHQSLKEPVA